MRHNRRPIRAKLLALLFGACILGMGSMALAVEPGGQGVLAQTESTDSALPEDPAPEMEPSDESTSATNPSPDTTEAQAEPDHPFGRYTATLYRPHRR